MPNRQFRIGDRVEIAVHNPRYGRGAVERDEIGTICFVRHNTSRDLEVNFPSHNGLVVHPPDLRLVEAIGRDTDEEDEPTYRCDWCSTEVQEDEISFDDSGIGVCVSCQDNAIQCENCNCWTDEWCSCADYCPDCHNEHCPSDYIHEYHTSHHRPRRFLPDKHQDLYLGIELEMETRSGIDDVARALSALSDNENLFLMEEDGSLTNGLEIVSEPATLAYHKTNFGWDKILSSAKANGAVSHDSDNCGLHIHFGLSFFDHTDEAIDLNSAKLLYFFERFWQPLVKFSRRTHDQLSEYAGRYGAFLDKVSPKASCDYAKDAGRNYAINLQNHSTIEIRIFRGTLELETFYACLELVDFLARYVKKRSIHYIQRTTWAKVVKAIKAKDYPNLVKYLERRELLNVPNHS